METNHEIDNVIVAAITKKVKKIKKIKKLLLIDDDYNPDIEVEAKSKEKKVLTEDLGKKLNPFSKMNYSEMKKDELKALCKERKIKGITGKNKVKLIEMLTQSESTPVSAQKNEAETDVKVEPVIKVEIAEEIAKDTYTKDLLKEQYGLHKAYVNGRINTTKKIGVKVRLPCIPEDISENIVKFILHNKLKDTTSRWDCKKGDLQSKKEGKQECKCFTSDGPPSFTPSSDWDVIYFLDARNWLNDKFILYRVLLKRTSSEWKNIKVSKTQTFEDQTKQGRRPRITWESLQPQISSYCNKVYDGTFDDIFNPLEVKE